MIEQYDIDPKDDDLEIESFLEYAKKVARTNINIRKLEHPQKEVKRYDELNVSAAAYRKDASKNRTRIPGPVALSIIDTATNTAKEILTMNNLADIMGQLSINIVKTMSEKNEAVSGQ